jgi:hypothetical protein
MTRKHFKALAAMVAGLEGRVSEVDRRLFCKELSDVCKGFNGQFKRETFKRACNVEDEKDDLYVRNGEPRVRCCDEVEAERYENPSVDR